LAPDLDARIRSAWQEARAPLAAELRQGVAASNTVALYDTQLRTANLLLYAEHYGDVALLDDLAGLYNLARPGLVQRNLYSFYYAAIAGKPELREQVLPIRSARYFAEPPASGAAVGQEVVLHSSQFAYALSRTMGAIAALSPTKRTARLRAFAEAWFRAILEDHYRRWVLGRPGEPGVFQVRGWGCNVGTFTHREHVDNLLHHRYGTSAFPNASFEPTSYCNAVVDTDMWIAAGVAELLAANAHAPDMFPIDAGLRAELLAYVRRACELFASRTQATALVVAGKWVEGRGFDHGVWDGHPEHAYAGYEDAQYPGWSDPAHRSACKPPARAYMHGWDVSHARRWVTVFDTFRRRGPALGTKWPSREDLVGFARQFAFAVYRDTPKGPAFTNFMDGTNGWYRVNDSERAGAGYPPFGLSEQVPLSGYALWATYERETRAAIDRYLAVHPLVSAVDRIQALPSLAPFDSEPSL
jgi:hypothetical protein